MTELITQYGPYALIVLAAFVLFAAGHHVGSSTVATPATTVAAPATVLSKVGQDGKVELALNKTPSKTIAEIKAEVASNDVLVENSADHVVDALSKTRQLADEMVAQNPDAALNVHQTLTESLAAAGHLDVKSADPAADVWPVGTPAKHPDALDSILPTKVLASAPLADIQAVIAASPAVVSDASPVTKLDTEVAKAHDALDKAGVFGPNRLIAIAAVRAGQVTGDDVARANPVIQELQPVPQAPAQQ